jgi:hypothetical protein
MSREDFGGRHTSQEEWEIDTAPLVVAVRLMLEDDEVAILGVFEDLQQAQACVTLDATEMACTPDDIDTFERCDSGWARLSSFMPVECCGGLILYSLHRATVVKGRS